MVAELTVMDKKEQVISFVKDKLWEPKGGLTLESRLFHDLGVDGDDGVDFLIAYCEKFDVPVTDIQFNMHFGSEAGATPFTFIRWIIDKDFRKGKKMMPIRIKDLIEGADKKRWPVYYPDANA